MGIKLNCLEPLTAIGIGVGACALAPLDMGLTAGAVIGSAGLFARIRENSRKAGLDDKALVARMQTVILRQWDHWQDTPERRDAVTLADAAMTRLLPQVMLTREELARTATESAEHGYPAMAARKVVDAIGKEDPSFRVLEDGSQPLARQFALQVLERALKAAKEDRDYATFLTLDIAIELGRAIAENSAFLKKMAERADAHREVSDENNAMLRQLLAQLGPSATDRGVPEQTLIDLARRASADVSGIDEAMSQLELAIEKFVEFQREAETGTNLGGQVDAALRRIADRNVDNDLDGAAAEGERAWAELADQEAALHAGRLKIAEANIAQNRLRFDAPAVASWIVRRIELEDGGAGVNAIFAKIGHYRDQALKRGLRFELNIAIELARIALDKAGTLKERGDALVWLGNATSEQGERTGGPDGLRLLDEAVAAYRDALTILTRAEMPADWAMTQSNLAAALQTQGERTGGPDGLRLLDEAVAAYRDALTVHTRVEMPADWAMTQNNLANALKTQGARTGGPDGLRLLDEAVAAYRDALTVLTRAEMPAAWAMTQNNLGIALSTQGERTGGPDGLRLLEEAVAAYRDALTVRTRAEMPAAWAMTQNNLAAALQTQGARTGGPDGLRLLDEAVAAYRDALTVRTRAEMPANWAMTQENLGLALESIADLGFDPASNLKQAEDATLAALEVYTPEHMPYDHGTAIASLARIRAKLATLNN